MRLFCDFQTLCTFKNLEKWTNRKNLEDNFGFDRVSNVAQRNWVKFRVTYKEIKKLKIGERNRDVNFFYRVTPPKSNSKSPKMKNEKTRAILRTFQCFSLYFSIRFTSRLFNNPEQFSQENLNIFQGVTNQWLPPLFSKLTPLSTGSKEFFDTKFSRQLRHFEVGKKWF